MDIFTTLQNIFRDVFDLPTLAISENTTADEIDDWDSVAQVNLVLTIENEFSIRLSIEEATETHSVRGFMQAIEKHL